VGREILPPLKISDTKAEERRRSNPSSPSGARNTYDRIIRSARELQKVKQDKNTDYDAGAHTSTTLADLVYAAILCRDFFGSAGIAEAVA
jgi:hypothetical protein